MFSSGSNTQDSGQNYPTQWALNPSAYQNVSNDQVDWAALAQQWIMMKETVPPEQLPPAPPPPIITGKKEPLNEGGEAPMDVENDKDDSDSRWEPETTTHSQEPWNWQQWGWNSNWNGPPGVPPPASVNSANKTALLPTPFASYASSNVESSNSNSDYQNNAPPSNEYNSGYWTNSGNSRSKSSIKPRVPRKSTTVQEPRSEFSSETMTLDAAKRRQLPAWIREGLEKMEREKQKQMDREREKLEREEYLSRKKEETEDAMKILQSSGLPEKSKFESDTDESGNENNGRCTPSPRRESPVLTEEEKMEKMMTIVRRAMTEVLLQVTSIEIESICQEELNRFRSKQSASAKKGLQGTPSAGSVSGTLGLGIYGESGSSSNDDSDTDDQTGSGNDSDAKLKETIKKRRAEFAKTEREIESRLNETRAQLVSSDNGETSQKASTDTDIEDSQVDTAQCHGPNSKLRKHSQRSSSRTPPRWDRKQSVDKRDDRHLQKKSMPKPMVKKKSDSSSDSNSPDSSSSSDSSDSEEYKRSKHSRNRSKSLDSLPRRRKRQRSRSASSDSDKRRRDDSRDRHERDRTHGRRNDRRERARRDRSRSRRRSRSRSRSRGRRSDRRRSRSRSSRSRSRSKRYRHRSRSRSHSSDRRRRSPHGGGKKARGH